MMQLSPGEDSDQQGLFLNAWVAVFMEDRKIEREKDTGRQIGRGRERHKTVRQSEKEIVNSLFPQHALTQSSSLFSSPLV